MDIASADQQTEKKTKSKMGITENLQSIWKEKDTCGWAN